MKKKLNFLGIISVLTLVFGCSKGENDQNQYYFRANVQGSKIEAEKHHASVTKNSLAIFGIWNEKEAISFLIKNFNNTAGTFEIDFPEKIDNQAKYHKNFTSTDKNQHFGTSIGSLTITEINAQTIKGTFSFVAKSANNEEVTISEGEFFLPLTSAVVNLGEQTAVDLEQKFTEIIPKNILEDIQSRGFQIYKGNNPPNVEGAFLSQPHILISPYGSDDFKAGHQWLDRTYTLYNQQGSKINLDISATDTNETGYGFYIMGEGNKFTIFAEIQGVERGVKKRDVTLLSGEISIEGIRNLQAAYTLTWKEGDLNNTGLMPVGKSRISGDKDGLAKRVR